jgi:uncharacterized protein YjbI with pentapeptide repeats
MIGTLLIGGIISLIIAAVTAYLLLRVFRRELALLHAQIQSQEAQQQRWRDAQEHLISDLQQQLSHQLDQFQVTQKTREAAENERFDTLIGEYETITKKARLEYELAQLPRVEDIPLPGQNHQSQNSAPLRTPPNLQGYDLSGRDLSSRYLNHADLHQSNLAHTKLYMADLSNADLSGSDLTEAELSGADLTHANLRGATLRGASFLVADLNHAILIGCDLRDAHSLSPEQVATTIYDASTQFDPDLASQLPSASQSRIARPFEAALETAQSIEEDKDTSRMKAVRKNQNHDTSIPSTSSTDDAVLFTPISDPVQIPDQG